MVDYKIPSVRKTSHLEEIQVDLEIDLAFHVPD